MRSGRYQPGTEHEATTASGNATRGVPGRPKTAGRPCVVVHRGDPGALAAGPAGAGRIWLVIMPQHSGDEGPQHAVLAPAPGQAGRSDRPRRDTARRAQRPQDQARGPAGRRRSAAQAGGAARRALRLGLLLMFDQVSNGEAAPQRRREDAARARAHDQAGLAGRERQAVLDRREHNPPSRPHPEFRPRQGPGPPMLPEPASPPHPRSASPGQYPLRASGHLSPRPGREHGATGYPPPVVSHNRRAALSLTDAELRPGEDLR